MRALDVAATGMAAMDLQVQVIAGNIANMSTTGYKSQRAEFQDLVYEHVQRIGAQASDQGNILPVGIELGSGVKTVGTPRLMTQGSLQQTGNTLDVAIQGSGWFKVLMPDGTFGYTRDGSFQMDSQGRVVTAEGNLVQPTITIPANSSGLTINQQGQVSVTPAGSSTSSILGQFTLTTFMNDAGLQANGNNLFTATPASGTPQDGTPGTNNAGTLLQGSLEESNVDAVTEISNLIAAQRAYEMNSKVVSAADQMLQTTSQLSK
jgi:flagellar basal-body rod protein FlgG